MSNSEKKILAISLFICCFLFIFSLSYDEIASLSILMYAFSSFFFVIPLSKLINIKKYQLLYWILFLIILVYILSLNLAISVIVNVAMIIVGKTTLQQKAIEREKNETELPSSNAQKLCSFCNQPVNETDMYCSNCGAQVKDNVTPTKPAFDIVLNCAKCGGVLTVEDKFCTHCGSEIVANNIVVNEVSKKVIVNPSDFGSMYNLGEEELVETFIRKELIKAQINENGNMVPEDILKRKRVFKIIFAILVFIYVSLVFFHFPIYTYITGAVILAVFYILTNKYSLVKYIKKEVKSRPSEKISNIVMNVRMTLVTNNTKTITIISLIVAVIMPLIIFFKPHIMYENIDGGYSVRFYTFGLTNFTTATIPKSYNDKPVVSLRGNTFSNMPFLKSVDLPDTITEIRGQAFKNDISLKQVNIPSKLKYLGGGSFYNCKSIEKINLPDTLEYLGGESFYNAKSLKEINIPSSLTEIRGNTFENCSSLESIEIPDSITRIGGHAFYGNTSLKEVKLTENSKLKEIGSSAFRMCTNLDEITLPGRVSINERAFKESPTEVKYFGYMPLENNYRYTEYLSIHEGKTYVLAEFVDAIVHNHTLKVDSVSCHFTTCEYKITYDNLNTQETFILSDYNYTKKLSEDLYIEVPRYSDFGQYGLTITIYYN